MTQGLSSNIPAQNGRPSASDLGPYNSPSPHLLPQLGLLVLYTLNLAKL